MGNEKINSWAARFGTDVIIKYRFLFWFVIIILLILGYMGTERLVFDTSNESFLPEGDEAVKLNDRFKELFGNEDFVFVFVEADDVFDYKVLSYIRELGKDLERNLPFVKDVVSLGDVEYIEAEGDVLNISDLIGDTIPQSKASLKDIKEKVLKKKGYVDRLVSKDARYTGIAVGLKTLPDKVYISKRERFSPLDQVNLPPDQVILKKDILTGNQLQEKNPEDFTLVEDPRKLIPPALKVIMGRHDPGKAIIKSTGIPVIDFEGEVITSSEGEKFGLFSLIASIILLFIIFRTFRAVLAPFLVLLFTMILLFGLMGWLRIAMSITSMMISPLILVISVGYAIHVINHFQYHFYTHGIRREAVAYTFEQSTWPCFLTALTTALGFVSFLVVPIKPIREMGLVCGMGVFITYILVMIIIPTVFSLGKDRKADKISEQENSTHKNNHSWAARWADMVMRNKAIIAIFSVIFVGLLIWFSFNIHVNTDVLKMMGDKVDYVNDARYISDRLGGSYSFEVLIELPEEGMAKDPKVLKVVDDLSNEIATWESVKNTSSITHILKDLNMTMNENRESFYTLPGSKELVAQYLLLYEMSGGENLEDVVDFDYRYLHITVLVKGFTANFDKKFKDLEENALKFLPIGSRVKVVGDIPILLRMLTLLTQGQIKSIFIAFLVITIIMIIILQSFKLGLISMVPNILPVFSIAGIMGALGLPIDLMTIMIAPMIIGIAVDDTVHYLIHFNMEFKVHRNYADANRATFIKVGRAILFTSVILSMGFTIMGLSIIDSMKNMALLSAIGIISALVADLFITPVLIGYFKPLSVKEKE